MARYVVKKHNIKRLFIFVWYLVYKEYFDVRFLVVFLYDLHNLCVL